MQLLLLRHGKTKGNLEQRYIGSTDEDLCEAGIVELQEKARKKEIITIQQQQSIVVTSPLKRCIQTAKLLFPNKKSYAIEELREIAFGDFENKNYQELSDLPSFQEWIDSNGENPFPNGESKSAFCDRCCTGLRKVMEQITQKEEKPDLVIMVVHGGTIMAILDRYEDSEKSYYDYQCKNGNGYLCNITWSTEKNNMQIQLKILSEI